MGWTRCDLLRSRPAAPFYAIPVLASRLLFSGAAPALNAALVCPRSSLHRAAGLLAAALCLHPSLYFRWSMEAAASPVALALGGCTVVFAGLSSCPPLQLPSGVRIMWPLLYTLNLLGHGGKSEGPGA